MKFNIVMAAAVALAAIAAPATAANLVTNGGFETLTNGIGQMGYNTDATGWHTSGYNFVFGGNTADSVGATGSYGGLKLWGPANGAANGLGASPNGGNYVGADGAFAVGAITQTITGLTAGKSYDVSFYWGGAQQQGYTGLNTEQWEVSLGGPSQFTAVYTNGTGGFSGWFHETLTFTAGASSEILSFLAHGTPDGVPPFSVLDGVTLNATGAVPEPATWALMLAGFGFVGVTLRKRRNSNIVVAA